MLNDRGSFLIYGYTRMFAGRILILMLHIVAPRPLSPIVAASAVLLIFTGCTRAPETRAASPPTANPSSSTNQTAQRANPASEHCVASGGRLAIETLPNAVKYGVCMFEDNRQCEEWALLRGECAIGGKRITGYATSAGRYCVITGGEYAVRSSSDATDERGECAFPDGKRCDADAYYHGECVR